MPDPNPLRIFVAMPGTEMGPNATYKNPEAVKQNLLEPVREKLAARLGREVKLVIEKDKRQAGVIHASMFNEARDADVYIADLTGANPNVYLELGVRWALRDRVTVPISQSVEDLKFNVFANRAILYYPDIIIKAIDDIVAAIVEGLMSDGCDSPVRLNAALVTIPRSRLESLEAEVQRLQQARGEDLLRAALAASEAKQRAALLEQAVSANPASVDALLELGKAYRSLAEYEKAEESLRSAQRLDPGNAVLYRELGVAYSKQKKLELAASALREAVRLEPEDAEAWSNLGGALRRLGMAGAPASLDRTALEEARNSYQEAHRLEKFDLYSGLNVARLNLLLSKWDPSLREQAKEGFRRQLFLCRHMVEENPQDYWRRFDLADALLFSGAHEEAQRVFGEAIELTPAEKRKDVFISVLGPLRDYLEAGVLDGALRSEVEQVIARLEDARG